ncbi:uncharacterized protein TNCV_4230531 [Trichonephila clavipes]|uniref:Mutator-like transposase domain-containing protein n=1 Tax=Trichonephila clavipes TaxID=2585209 RepID=A0A8X6VG90_TRICX|nr:uncharacterized protein TNCV_4230531 [Trichonephila clavipes]
MLARLFEIYRNSKQRCLKPFITIENSRLKWKILIVDLLIKLLRKEDLEEPNHEGDGDTKTFNALSENKPYGDDYLIQKIECVGHVQKRMGTRLMKLKLVYSKKELSDGKTIGGKGRLTDSLIDLAHYYGNAIRCNSTSVKEMRKAIWAVWGIWL